MTAADRRSCSKIWKGFGTDQLTMSLAQQAALDDLAQHLYDFLPGKAHPYADQSLSFPGVAKALGLERYWPGGSKQPAIRTLLGSVIAANRDLTSLILKIVERSITYRKRSNPLTREQIDRLNEILLRVGYKIPELHELAFLSRLPRTESQSDAKAASTVVDSQTLATFQKRLLKLSELDPHPRGYAFQDFLSELFHAYGLAPRGAFRLTGEEIDGSFSLNHETYLLEAKWQNEQVGQSALITFQGKVEGKAQWRNDDPPLIFEWTHELGRTLGRFPDWAFSEYLAVIIDFGCHTCQA
jgi:hypothetical protein